MDRIYDILLKDHFKNYRQMAFVSGPRQVGKTTTANKVDAEALYLNWDKLDDRLAIVRGEEHCIKTYNLDNLQAENRLLIFDEVHKYGKWKQFLKGFFDSYGAHYRILVTGSARLNIYKKIGDSLMGRYFPYRMHPVSIGEVADPSPSNTEIRLPCQTTPDILNNLLEYSGFPEPFLKVDKRFYNRWRRLRTEQLLHEDIRDLTNIHEIAQLEILAEIIRHQTGQLINYSTLAKHINVSVDTIRRWISVLENLYYCFTIRPYYTNVPKALRKQPKIYLWDWSLAGDRGAKCENLVASHLLKTVHYWNDSGFGNYNLHYLRDKAKREVDFLVSREGAPWFLVEVKTGTTGSISPHLHYFSGLLKPQHAFQIELEAPYIEADCFTSDKPMKVPALTLLSQLM